MITVFPATGTDGYKVDHIHQYADGTQQIVSNLTARGTRRTNTKKVVFFGLQYFLKKYLIKDWQTEFFDKPKAEVVKRFKRRIDNYLGPNNVGTAHIEALHDLGYLPLEIYALPEGTEHGLRVPSVMIWNTLPEFFWLTNYIETIFSTTIWGPCTSATTAHQYKKLLTRFALETVGDAGFVQFQGHDFSFRGMFGVEAALMSGGAHLISFVGTDTVPAIDWLEDYYNADSDKELVGCSVAATEHSVACSVILDFVNKVRIEKHGAGEVIIEDELMQLADIEYVRRLINVVYPKGIVSIVADSFDYWNTITHTAKVLKPDILARDGKVVFRPDTGDPVKVVCGYKLFQSNASTTAELAGGWEYNEAFDGGFEYISTVDGTIFKVEESFLLGHTTLGQLRSDLSPHEIKGSIECLWDIFGGTVSPQGYRVLDGHVGLIYGDSITWDRCLAICEGLKAKKFASVNLVYGIGSFTYQYVTRDTDGYAVKATFCRVNGIELPIFKKPKTGDGTKNSAVGLTSVYNEGGEFILRDMATWEQVRDCAFIPVFKDGKLLKDWSLAEVRANLAQYL